MSFKIELEVFDCNEALPPKNEFMLCWWGVSDEPITAAYDPDRGWYDEEGHNLTERIEKIYFWTKLPLIDTAGREYELQPFRTLHQR